MNIKFFLRFDLSFDIDTLNKCLEDRKIKVAFVCKKSKDKSIANEYNTRISLFQIDSMLIEVSKIKCGVFMIAMNNDLGARIHQSKFDLVVKDLKVFVFVVVSEFLVILEESFSGGDDHRLINTPDVAEIV